MITLIKKSNAAQYNLLYEQAENMLKTHDDQGNEVAIGDANAIMSQFILDEEGNPTEEENHISSLEEYFSYIKELSRLDKKFTMLPLDEDIFEIDLDTRAITVPSTFAKNGISVQGDEVAEVVYFKCNRYFDSVDLSTRDIFIQWESAAKDADGNVIKGVSVPWVIDLETGYPDYIIFGWPLSTKITAAPGTVKFAVRFYEWNADLQQITYSLSTLTQTATIKPSLDYMLKDIIMDGSLIDDARDLILDRFENTVPVNVDGEAADPEILAYLVKRGGVNFVVLPEEASFARQCLAEDVDGFKANAIELAVSASSADAGRLSYEWKRQALPSYEGEQPQNVVIPSEIKMIETADEARVEGKVYYQVIPNSDPVAYQIYTGDFVSDDPEVELPTIYEKVSAAQVDATGRYSVVITNRVNRATGTTTSAICLVPAPEAPVINADVAARAALRADDYVATLSVGAEAPDEGKLTYQWKRLAPGAETAEVIEGANAAEYAIEGSAEVIDGVAVGDGSYFVEITNNLNKEKNMVVSAACRVTHGASKPLIALAADTQANMRYEVAGVTGIGVEASIDAAAGESRSEEDSLTYQWYRYTVGSDRTSEVDHQKAAALEYEVDDDILIPGATEARYTPVLTDVGYALFCEVTNTYNGDQAKICSPFVDILQG